MVRTQVQFTEEQIAELRRLAAEKGVSVSELVRRGVDHVLREEHGPDRKELMRRALEVAGKYDSGLTDIGRRHDDYLAEDFGH